MNTLRKIRWKLALRLMKLANRLVKPESVCVSYSFSRLESTQLKTHA